MDVYIETSWGRRGERRGGRGRRRRKREKFLTIVNISKKKYMPKNAYFIPSNICRRVLPPPTLPPIPFDDDPAKIFSQAISQQGYHFNNRKYLLPEMTFTLSAFLFLFFSSYKYQNKRKKKKNSHAARSKTETSPPFPFTAYYSLLRVVVMVVVMVIHCIPKANSPLNLIHISRCSCIICPCPCICVCVCVCVCCGCC